MPSRLVYRNYVTAAWDEGKGRRFQIERWTATVEDESGNVLVQTRMRPTQREAEEDANRLLHPDVLASD